MVFLEALWSGVNVTQQTQQLLYKDNTSYDSLHRGGEATNDCETNIHSSFTPEVKGWEDAPHHPSDLRKSFNGLGLST